MSGDEWKIRYANGEAVRGWQEPLAAAPGNLRKVRDLLRHSPGELAGLPPLRHHRLKYDLATGRHARRELPQWQIEVTGGGRVRCLLDEENHTGWLRYAGTGHPKLTE
ncbi:hypothetical protein [Saccharomonospora cyanea]|uniref:hypothetical protein n=1 Tax=Saccharomonospora cyanea TaxID=40989 RepID=UPI0002DF54C4|nr:hypothetical protein [Saccharomonospora cyanea]